MCDRVRCPAHCRSRSSSLVEVMLHVLQSSSARRNSATTSGASGSMCAWRYLSAATALSAAAHVSATATTDSGRLIANDLWAADPEREDHFDGDDHMGGSTRRQWNSRLSLVSRWQTADRYRSSCSPSAFLYAVWKASFFGSGRRYSWTTQRAKILTPGAQMRVADRSL